MFAYDPATFGTPLSLLQIPQQAIRDITSKVNEPNCPLAQYTQDCKALSELKTMVSAKDYSVARESTVDVGLVCKKCHMVYPQKEACMAHQQSLCFVGKSIGDGKSMCKLEQVQYKCRCCHENFSTLQEFKVHCDQDVHKSKREKYFTNSASHKARSEETRESAAPPQWKKPEKETAPIDSLSSPSPKRRDAQEKTDQSGNSSTLDVSKDSSSEEPVAKAPKLE